MSNDEPSFESELHAEDQTRDRLVQSQYEQFPYPERIPADEAKRLVIGSPSHLPEVEHYVFGGQRDPSAPLRALVAGGGTGDATIMLAQALAERGRSDQVTHLDLSAASIEVARARAAVRALTNIRFLLGSLLDVAHAAPGPWDYIDCCGVLHHLHEPEQGLRALVSELAPHGGIGLMLYGELGRTGIYHVRDMLRLIAPAGRCQDAERLSVAKQLLAELPRTSWLHRNGQIRDHVAGGDPGIFDLFLHARDRAFDVRQVLALLAASGMRLMSFVEPYRYDPSFFVREPDVSRLIKTLGVEDRAVFAELWAGSLKKHVLYAVRENNDVQLPSLDRDAVPVLTFVSAAAAARNMPSGGTITVETDGMSLELEVPMLASKIVALCDGTRTVFEIFTALGAAGGLDWEAFVGQFTELYRVMNGINQMLLRIARPGTPTVAARDLQGTPTPGSRIRVSKVKRRLRGKGGRR